MDIQKMVADAREAQRLYERQFDQEQVDRVIKAAAHIIYDNAEYLARMTVDETQMGVYEDKVSKNRNKAKGVWYNLRGKKSMGIIGMDDRTGLIEIAKPIGVVAGITPMTNPVVTPMSKIIFALKTKNAIIIAPHPKARRCSAEAVRLIKEAIAPFGVPDRLVQVITEPDIETTRELMEKCDVVVATGGMQMVKSAYSSGKPSFGVGVGNVQVIIDRDIDFDTAASRIITGRAFDNGIICSGEQCFLYHEKDESEVLDAFRRHGAYIVSEEEKRKLVPVLFPDGKLNRELVGQSVRKIAAAAGLEIPGNMKVIAVRAAGPGKEDLICKEKMFPVLAYMPYAYFDQALEFADMNLTLEGNGHTAGIHSNNQANIIKAGTSLSVSRLIVNAPCATTAGGSIQNGLPVTNTLGCGSWGNNSISENFTYKHLLNITRIAPISARIPVPTDEEIWSEQY